MVPHSLRSVRKGSGSSRARAQSVAIYRVAFKPITQPSFALSQLAGRFGDEFESWQAVHYSEKLLISAPPDFARKIG